MSASVVHNAALTLYVTGKGGAGKSYVAESLAVESAARGHRTALVELVEADRRCDRPPPADPQGMHVHRMRLNPRSSLAHLLRRLLPLPLLTDRVLESRTFTAVAAAAPGLGDLVRLNHLRELARGRVAGRFDTVVVDAPASGHALAMFTAPLRLQEVVARGPAAAIVAATRRWLEGARALRTIVVAAPEEMSIVETEEACNALSELGINVAAVVVNGLYPPVATVEQEAWIDAHAVSEDARLYLTRRRQQVALRARLAAAGRRIVDVPYAFDSCRDERWRGALLDAVLGAAP